MEGSEESEQWVGSLPDHLEFCSSPLQKLQGKRIEIWDCRDSDSVQKTCHPERSSLRAKAGGNGAKDL